MPNYRVVEKCFIGGVLREPGDNDVYVSDKLLKPCPAYLRLDKSAKPVVRKPAATLAKFQEEQKIPSLQVSDAEEI